MAPFPAYCFSWQDCRFVLHTKEAELVNKVATLLALVPVKIPVTDEPPDLLVYCQDSGWVSESMESVQYFDRQDDLLLNIMVQLSTQMRQKTEHLLIHAGAFVVHGQAILFTGPSTIGKSSLAAIAWLAGFEVIVDDLLAIDPDANQAFAFPKALKPRILDRELPEHFLGRLDDANWMTACINNDYRLVLGRSSPRMADYAKQYPIASLYLLERAKGAISVVEKIDKQFALAKIISQTMITTRRTPLDIVRVLGFLLKRGEVYRLQVGEHDFERAIELMTAKIPAKLNHS